MGSGAKIGSGFLGFCIVGALASQFADPVPPVKDLEFGPRFFKNTDRAKPAIARSTASGAAAISIASAYLRTSTWF